MTEDTPINNNVDSVVSLNVGGRVFEFTKHILDQHPSTLLAKAYDEKCLPETESKPIFIDGNPDRFEYVLDYMRMGRVSLPLNITKTTFLNDMKYYGFTNISEIPVDVASGRADTMIRLAALSAEYEKKRIYLKEQSDLFEIGLEHWRQAMSYLQNQAGSSNQSNFNEFQSTCSLASTDENQEKMAKVLEEFGLQLVSMVENQPSKGTSVPFGSRSEGTTQVSGSDATPSNKRSSPFAFSSETETSFNFGSSPAFSLQLKQPQGINQFATGKTVVTTKLITPE